MNMKKTSQTGCIPPAQMNAILRYCKLLDDVKIILNMPIRTDLLKALNELGKELNRRNHNALARGERMPAPSGMYEYDLFMYGYITGVRAERQKRRAKA